MTLTDDEKAYYRDRLWDAIKIMEMAELDPVEELIGFVFDKIASPLYFLREGQQQRQGVPEKHSPIELGQTTFKEAKGPNAHGMTHFTYATNVQRDLRDVLNQLSVQNVDTVEHLGFVYELSHFDKKDWLWRKKKEDSK